jgi:hypothetical protein
MRIALLQFCPGYLMHGTKPVSGAISWWGLTISIRGVRCHPARPTIFRKHRLSPWTITDENADEAEEPRFLAQELDRWWSIGVGTEAAKYIPGLVLGIERPAQLATFAEFEEKNHFCWTNFFSK